MFCGSTNIPHNIPLITLDGEYLRIFSGIWSVPRNIVMEFNNVMELTVLEIIEFMAHWGQRMEHYMKALSLLEGHTVK